MKLGEKLDIAIEYDPAALIFAGDHHAGANVGSKVVTGLTDKYKPPMIAPFEDGVVRPR